ncbi:NAD-dependent protein lipoamidase sirtuin-4, mitochondrial [Nymphon striatum]|nr:NAD-dependent protein lipoamidase sirtuin-4, mitochondrial [Nymphon striatum]
MNKLSSKFVPNHIPVQKNELLKLQEFVNSCSSLFVLTGAGVSTESGIPDYRSEGVGLYARSNSRPMKIQQFIASDLMKKRYWARNFIGWPYFSSLKPNNTHITLFNWEKYRKINWLVTQNVDSLHLKAGSERVTQLHGTGYVVKCLDCNYTVSRHDYQKKLKEVNKDFEHEMTLVRPDGDVDISDEKIQSFVIPPCPECGGMVKPDIVFFGDNVPKKIVEFAYAKVKESDGVLIAGSSLQVFAAVAFHNNHYDHEDDLAELFS